MALKFGVQSHRNVRKVALRHKDHREGALRLLRGHFYIPEWTWGLEFCKEGLGTLLSWNVTCVHLVYIGKVWRSWRIILNKLHWEGVVFYKGLILSCFLCGGYDGLGRIHFWQFLLPEAVKVLKRPILYHFLFERIHWAWKDGFGYCINWVKCDGLEI